MTSTVSANTIEALFTALFYSQGYFSLVYKHVKCSERLLSQNPNHLESKNVSIFLPVLRDSVVSILRSVHTPFKCEHPIIMSLSSEALFSIPLQKWDKKIEGEIKEGLVHCLYPALLVSSVFTSQQAFPGYLEQQKAFLVSSKETRTRMTPPETGERSENSTDCYSCRSTLCLPCCHPLCPSAFFYH